MTHDDLWGDLPEGESVTTPQTILKQQADALTKRTRGKLRGEVGDGSVLNMFRFVFSIIAPAINGYRYELLSVQHDIDLYPARVTSQSTDDGPSYFTCQNEESFTSALTTILQSRKTKRAIANLLAQSTGGSP